MFLAPSRSDPGESLLITTLLGIPLGEPDGKTPTAGTHRGASCQWMSEELDGSFRRQLSAKKGTSFYIGCRIFIADGSGGFESCSSDQNPPEVFASHHEFDDFIDRLKEVGFPALSSETRIQPEFGEIKIKTLSELEEDLDRLLEDTKQETSMEGSIFRLYPLR